MNANLSRDDSSSRKPFATTRWSLIVAAGQENPEAARQALEQLCESYWYPLYALLRRKGYEANEAQDLTQEFFAFVLENETFRKADQKRGRFRSFLLTSMQNFVSNQHRAKNAQKRGGGRLMLSIDFTDGEQKYRQEPTDAMTAESVFERRWAMTLLGRAVDRLASEQAEAGKGEQFEVLKNYLGGGEPGRPYREIAEQLGIAEGTVKVSVFRLRQRCRELVREEIENTIGESDSVDEELRYLFTTLQKRS